MTVMGAQFLIVGERNRRLRKRDVAARVDGAVEALKQAQATASSGWLFLTLGPVMFLIAYYTF
jgi:hypothetical protein